LTLTTRRSFVQLLNSLISLKLALLIVRVMSLLTKRFL